jgi:hypothetical protein
MQGTLVSEVSFGRHVGVLDALLLPFLRMKVGRQVYVAVEAVEGRCKSSGICGRHWRWAQRMWRVSRSSEGIWRILGGGTMLFDRVLGL